MTDDKSLVSVFSTSVPAADAQTAERVRLILDHVANSAGLPSSINFNAAGERPSSCTV
jgi:hypothetical protein